VLTCVTIVYGVGQQLQCVQCRFSQQPCSAQQCCCSCALCMVTTQPRSSLFLRLQVALWLLVLSLNVWVECFGGSQLLCSCGHPLQL
jgi:hypothetical protein